MNAVLPFEDCFTLRELLGEVGLGRFGLGKKGVN